MERAITGYHVDEVGDWVAELACGHDQHVRHRPPFQVRAWVQSEETRAQRIGTTLACPPCARAEPPEVLRPARTGPEWTGATMPPGLRRAHRVGRGTWGRLRVLDGQLRLVLATEPARDTVLGPGSEAAIPPEVPHHVEPIGSVRFTLDFLAVDRTAPDVATGPEDRAVPRAADPDRSDGDGGGETACWSGHVCAGCGAVLDGGPHRPGCGSVPGG